MKEHFLSFVWMHRLYTQDKLITTKGHDLQIINTGYLNHDAGPDFLEAIIRIDGIEWRGHIELHVQSSDWEKHGHHTDHNYNNVILHVVYLNKCAAICENGVTLPCLELSSRLSNHLISKYNSLMSSQEWLPCASHLPNIRQITLSMTTEKWSYSRLENKGFLILERLDALKGNWLQLCYEVFLRGIGFHINGYAFELISRSTPIHIILKNATDIKRLEALLLGQANLITNCDTYTKSLFQEYTFLRKKYHLNPINKGVCKFLRTRPSNFPTLRLAQMAAIIHNYPQFIRSLVNNSTFDMFSDHFNYLPSDYWTKHSKCCVSTKSKNGKLGESAIQLLYINVASPLKFAYAIKTQNVELKEAVLKGLDDLPSENNKIIRNWGKYSIASKSAFQSQGLLELYKTQCSFKLCHKCMIGMEIINS